jgi:hypothetical protein
MIQCRPMLCQELDAGEHFSANFIRQPSSQCCTGRKPALSLKNSIGQRFIQPSVSVQLIIFDKTIPRLC